MPNYNSDSSLILRYDFKPLSICGFRNAICLLYRDRARALDRNFNQHDWDSWLRFTREGTKFRYGQAPDYYHIHTVSLAVAKPHVLVLDSNVTIPYTHLQFNKHQLLLRDNHTCQYCGYHSEGKNNLSIDHVVPRSKGGKTSFENCVVACKKCNKKKGSKSVEEAGYKLKQKPTTPGMDQSLLKRIRNNPTWSYYVLGNETTAPDLHPITLSVPAY